MLPPSRICRFWCGNIGWTGLGRRAELVFPPPSHLHNLEFEMQKRYLKAYSSAEVCLEVHSFLYTTIKTVSRVQKIRSSIFYVRTCSGAARMVKTIRNSFSHQQPGSGNMLGPSSTFLGLYERYGRAPDGPSTTSANPALQRFAQLV